MTLLNPLAWYFLALLPLLVALYLFRPRRSVVRVSTLLFWNRAAGASAQQSWFQKLRRFWSLLFSLLLFALLLLALGRFNFQLSGERKVDAVIIAIDATWSMQAKAPGAEQIRLFTQAQQAAAEILDRLPRGAEAALIGVSGRPEVLCGLTPQVSQVREALDNRYVPSQRDGDLQASLDLAKLLARESGAADRVKIYFLTDRAAEAGKLVEGAGGVPIQVVLFRARPGNVAITEFAVRPQPNDGQNVEAYVRIQNFGNSPITGEAQLSLDNQLLETLPLNLAAGGELRRVVSFQRPAAALNYKGHLELTAITKDDALPVDNTAHALLPAPRVRRVLLVTEGNWFLEKVLAANTATSYELLAPGSYLPAQAESFDLVVLDRVAPPLGEGKFPRLYIGGVPEELRGAAGEIPLPVVTSQEAVTGFTPGLGLERVLIRAAQSVKPGGELPAAWSWQPLLLSVTDPLVLVGEPGGEGPRVAVLPFDLLQSDLPLRIGFPVLMHDLFDWLARDPAGAESGRGLRLGDPEVDSMPGFHNGVVVNALDAGESAQGIAPAPRMASTPDYVGRAPILGIGAPIWVYLALIAACLVTGESVYLWRHARA